MTISECLKQHLCSRLTLGCVACHLLWHACLPSTAAVGVAGPCLRTMLFLTHPCRASDGPPGQQWAMHSRSCGLKPRQTSSRCVAAWQRCRSQTLHSVQRRWRRQHGATCWQQLSRCLQSFQLLPNRFAACSVFEMTSVACSLLPCGPACAQTLWMCMLCWQWLNTAYVQYAACCIASSCAGLWFVTTYMALIWRASNWGRSAADSA